jgi:arylsulfatase
MPKLPTALCLLLFAACAAPEEPARPKNVIVILADDLGYSELGCYGQELIRTPNIDRLAAAGMRFTQHYSGSPVCAPSRCVLMTGYHTGHAIVRNNWEGGGWDRGAPEGQYPLPEGTPTLARSLQDAGFATGCVGKWGLGGPETSGHPNRQGFDLFHGYLCQRIAHNYYPTHLWLNDEKDLLEGNEWFRPHQKLTEPLESDDAYYERYAAATYAPDVMTATALDFIADNAAEPFFLYFASTIPHVALQVPREDVEAYPSEWDEAPYLGQKGYLPHPSPRRAYAAMVSHLDRDVGRILDKLEELGIADETLVLFTSDNGPTFNGGSDSEFFDSAHAMRGLKCSVYEGGIRVPLIASWPGHIAPGSTSDHISAFEDILPTILELTSTAAHTGIDGISFAPTLTGAAAQPEHTHLYWEYGNQQALRAGDWKAVRRKLKKGDKAIEIYNLVSDPGERTDLSSTQPEVLARMQALLEASRFPSEVFPIPTLDGLPTNSEEAK